MIACMHEDNAIIQFFAENYSSYRQSQQIWRIAGGNPALVPEAEEPRARWRDLWRSAQAGRIDPLQLVRAALEDYPRNPVLLAYLVASLPETSKVRAAEALRELLSLADPRSDVQLEAALEPLRGLPEAEATTALAVAVEQAPTTEQERAKSIWTIVKEKSVETMSTEGAKFLLTKGLGLIFGVDAAP